MINDDKLSLKEQFLGYFKDVPIQKYAAAFIGKNEDTICVWKQEDADFSDQIERVKANFLRKNLKLVQSKQWIIERLFNDHFGDKIKVDIDPQKEILKTLRIIKGEPLDGDFELKNVD